MCLNNELSPGRVVFSKQGRDKGRFYLIKSNIKPDFAFCVNGAERKFNNPKKKRRKHLGLTHKIYDISFDDDHQGTKDALIRKLLKVYREDCLGRNYV